MAVDIDNDNYTANLIPDLSYFSYYENLKAFGKNDSMMDVLFIRHDFSKTNNKILIESTRCLLLSDFELEFDYTSDKIKDYFKPIGLYGTRRVYCYYRNDEDSDTDEYYVTVIDNDNYDDKFVEELRF